jgi:hypothetical protein
MYRHFAGSFRSLSMHVDKYIYMYISMQVMSKKMWFQMLWEVALPSPSQVYIIYIHRNFICIYVCIYIYIFIYTYIYVFIYICVLNVMRGCSPLFLSGRCETDIYIFMNMYIYICMYIRIYVYTYISRICIPLRTNHHYHYHQEWVRAVFQTACTFGDPY